MCTIRKFMTLSASVLEVNRERVPAVPRPSALDKRPRVFETRREGERGGRRRHPPCATDAHTNQPHKLAVCVRYKEEAFSCTMPSRCGQCAIALLVYVITATVLELYWMHPSTEHYTVLSMPPPSHNLPTSYSSPLLPPRVGFSPPPPPPTPSPFEDGHNVNHGRSSAHDARLSSADKSLANEKAVADAPSTFAATTVVKAPVTLATAASTVRSNGMQHGQRCWKTPKPFFEPPFDEGFASIVWARPTTPTNGPLEDIPAPERLRDWPKDKMARLERILPSRESLESRRYGSCAVVGSSPELLLYRDGSAIDRHEAVFRANLAVTEGWEQYVGRRTTVRVINPVESVNKARGKGDDAMAIIKNQDPPAIRSPSREHLKFLGEAETQPHSAPNYLARRSAIELCNYLLLASTLEEGPSGAKPTAEAEAAASAASAARATASAAASAAAAELDPRRRRKLEKAAKKAAAKAAALSGTSGAFNLTGLSARFRLFASGASKSWHPHGDGIPRFSPIHCSTGTVLLVQALLACKNVSLYGYHACACAKKCNDASISSRNHYWDKKETPRFGEMMSRYEHHMLFYQRLENSCELNFRIARKDHCDHAS